MKRTRTKSGVYIIRNLINGKVYVGSSVNVIGRWGEHRNSLEKNCHGNFKLQRAWNKYGADNFEFVRIKTCGLDDLLYYEQQAIHSFDSVKNGYNISPTAGNTLGTKCSEKTKAKIRAGNKGKIPWNKGKTGVFSPEMLRRRGMALKNRRRSKKTREKMSKAMKNKIRSDEYWEKFSFKGRHHTDKTKEKMSISSIGHIVSPATREKISKANKGRIVTPEAREKMSKAHIGLVGWNKGKHWPDAIKKKISDSLKARIPWNKGIPYSPENENDVKAIEDKLLIKEIGNNSFGDWKND